MSREKTTVSLIALTVVFLAARSEAAPRNGSDGSGQQSTSQQSMVPEATGEQITLLRQKLDGIFSRSDFRGATWGVYVYSASREEEIYSFNKHTLMVPASNMKLYTTAAALVKLGPNFRYETSLFRTGDIDPSGILNGSLVVRGSGDFSLSARFHNGNALKPFDDWIEELKKAGINKVRGDIVGDDSVFDNKNHGPGWTMDYLDDWYAAEVSGLALNDNCVDVYAYPGSSAGSPAVLKPVPDCSFVKFKNQALTGRSGETSGIRFDRPFRSNEITITGRVALGTKPQVIWITVSDPTTFFVTVLRERLVERGISVEGGAYSLRDYADKSRVARRELIAGYYSPPLSELVKVIGRNSQNLYAEQLFKTMGSRLKRNGSFAGGAKVVEEFLSGIGLDSRMYQFFDGSGLSRLNLVNAFGTVRLLDCMRGEQTFPVFLDSLPEAGRTGTLSSRMRGTGAEGNLYAKTGTIRNTRALSGYLTTREGELLVFSMFVNNFTPYSSGKPRMAIDEACVLLADFARN
ncbi:MAG TPA: D-alanyl-D-alanine carboxypeptidase/D-alanyl-D-alanine-endopeptidase [bacterium]|nr:D-alanyl-D-alanine carboxypeptidase/D-alanyl-D-alanine-endopeptidase [bacterium]